MKILYTLFCIILLTSQGICQQQELKNHENNTENEIIEHDQADHETFKRGRIAPVFAYSWVPKGDHPFRGSNWDICPHFTYTIKHGYESWKLGVAFGKRF